MLSIVQFFYELRMNAYEKVGWMEMSQELLDLLIIEIIPIPTSFSSKLQ